MNGQMDLDAQKNLAMGMINEVEIGSKQAAEELSGCVQRDGKV